MLPIERKQKIVEITKIRKSISVEELSSILNVSPATVRRDLTFLDASSQLVRTHGGAAYLDSDSDDFPLDMRENENTDKKELIASKAIGFIQDGETIFMDSSSTCGFLAKKLGRFHNLRVITNGMNIAAILSKFPDIEVWCTGGRLLGDKQAFVGKTATDFIDLHHAQTVFFSCKGMDSQYGISDSNEEQANVKIEMLRNSEKAFLLCDSTKFGQTFFCRICSPEDVYIISDKKLP